MTYAVYFVLYLAVQLCAYVVTPVLPLFAHRRYGWLDNANSFGEAYRLPKWLAWFDTPDNSLDGDYAFTKRYLNSPKYWRHLCWLYRNSLYGFKWTVLAAPMYPDRQVYGTTKLDYHAGEYGSLRIKMGRFWQVKVVRRFGSRVFIGNFGWLLDDTSKTKALFMFSPRFKKV